MTTDERIEALEVAVRDLQRRATTDAELPGHVDVEGLVVAQLARSRREDAWFRKESRILAFGLAALIFVAWVLQRVHVTPAEVAGLVGALLGALALFWWQLAKGPKLPPP